MKRTGPEVERNGKKTRRGPRKRVPIKATVEALDAIEGGDFERDHIEADRLLVEFVRVVAPAVADAYEQARKRVGFAYA